MQPRVYALAAFLPSLAALIVAVGVFGAPRPAEAADTVIKKITFTSETYQRGYTVRVDDNSFHFVIKPGTLSGPAVVTLTRIDTKTVPAWKDYRRRSDLYRVDITGTNLRILKPMTFDFKIVGDGYAAYVGKLDPSTKRWEELGAFLSSDGSRINAGDDKLTFSLAAFQSPTRQLGLATFYGTYTRTTNLRYVAASNTFPKGQVLRVTNLANGQMVTVKVVDTGAFRYPRVIDLSTPAFSRIADTSQGVIRVQVEKATPWNGQPNPVSTGGGQVKLDSATPPTTAATASVVIDAASGTRLLGKRSTNVYPIASLTKLMTAAVFLDTKTDLGKKFTYSSALDAAAYCSCLYLADGEQVIVKDLFFASLVGSANNATNALVRSTGLSRAEFVSRMNAKAKALGLQQTVYYDPTGLDARNVSSAEDIARLMRLLPDRYPTMKRALSTGSYWFRSQNTVCQAAYKQSDGSCRHSFVTTNKLLGQTSYTVVAAKTGYLDEALYTFAIRGRNRDGHELIVVLLRTATRSDSFNHADMLMDWTFEHATWT